MQSTISLFEQLIQSTPPLVSEDLKYQMRKSLKEAQSGNFDLKELEQLMVKYGFELWPYRQAFNEFLIATENQVGEQFFLAGLPADLQERYLEYKELGLTFMDFHRGRSAGYFNEEERSFLTASLLAMHNSVREFAVREVVGLKKEKYLEKINDFKIVLNKIKESLDNLRILADGESDHMMLADEIRSRVEAFEHGLCLLAPEFSHDEVQKAHEFFIGRKQELNRLRGIHETVEIDFYSE